ncbi:MAG: TlpA family protein disulfide reductase [Nitrospira sp.]|nr:MAG: TlpA family protein disulfide reductase [Nitrospira sp.]
MSQTVHRRAEGTHEISGKEDHDVKRLRNRATISVLTVAAVATCLSLMWSSAEGLSNTAPAFRLTTVRGEVYSTESLKGQPALLMFWAPWCHVCQGELPILAQFYLKQKPASLRVLAIGFADTRGHVEDYIKTNPGTFPFPTAYDAGDRVAGDFGVSATPTFVVLNAQGHIQVVHRGGGISQNPQYQAFLAALK